MRIIGLSQELRGNPRGEFVQLVGLAPALHKGPRQKARHPILRRVGGSVNENLGPFGAGGTFPEGWLPRRIKNQEAYALHHVLLHSSVLGKG